MTVVTNLVQNAQYAERVCEHDARTMHQLAATMQQMGRNLFDGFRQMQQQQERQEFHEFRGNSRGGIGGRGGAFRPAAPPPNLLRPPKIDSSTFPTFELPKREAEYFDTHQLWCRQVRNIIQANPGFEQLPMPALHAGILASLQGSANVMCQHIMGDTYATVDLLLAAVGNTTCGGAVQEKANNLFFKRAQKQSEDISQYCTS